MHLHVLPPAFGLPSIDAECNAAIALLQRHRKDRFDIVPTHGLNERLPCLVDGQTRVSGFNGIVRHLKDNGLSHESTASNPQSQADSIAITSFIESHAQILLDISLYVSFENYRHATRPAFTKFLPWYANYILPPRQRSAARTRTEHLGISSIDVDNVHEDMSNRPPGFDGVGKEQEFEAATQKRASLLLPRKETLRSLLQRPEHAAVFRLHALADNFFEPLQDMLGDRTPLSDFSGINAVDCLVFGYLALMLFPRVPQDWLASTMRRKYGKLVAYVERIQRQLELETNADNVMAAASCSSNAEYKAWRAAAKTSLRWRPFASFGIVDVVKYVAGGVVDQIPLVGAPYKLDLLFAPRPHFVHRHLSTLLLAIIGSSAGLTYLALRTGFLIWPHGSDVQIFGRRRLTDYGDLGAALAGISLMAPQIGQSK